MGSKADTVEDDSSEISVRHAIARAHAEQTVPSTYGWDQREIMADINLRLGVTDARLERAIVYLDGQAESIKRIIVAMIAHSSLTAVEVADIIINNSMDDTYRYRGP